MFSWLNYNASHPVRDDDGGTPVEGTREREAGRYFTSTCSSAGAHGRVALFHVSMCSESH